MDPNDQEMLERLYAGSISGENAPTRMPEWKTFMLTKVSRSFVCIVAVVRFMTRGKPEQTETGTRIRVVGPFSSVKLL